MAEQDKRLFSFKEITEDFKKQLPKEIFKLLLGIYLTIYIIVEKTLPFTQGLNGGKEITTIVVLLVGYVILLLVSGRKYIMEFNKGRERRRRATIDFIIYLLLALELLLVFCYSIGLGSVFAIFCLVVSIIAGVASVVITIFFMINLEDSYKLSESEERDIFPFLGSGLFGIIKTSFLMNLTIWIYYGAVYYSDNPVTEKYTRFTRGVKISGAVFSGLYTYSVISLMILISCFRENLDMKNFKWYLANRMITIVEYLMLLIYFLYSSAVIIIIFQCIYLLKFILTIAFLCFNRRATQNPENAQEVSAATPGSTPFAPQDPDLFTAQVRLPSLTGESRGYFYPISREVISNDTDPNRPLLGQVNQSASNLPNPAIANPAPGATRNPSNNPLAGVRQLSESKQGQPPPMEVIKIKQQEMSQANPHYPAPYRPPRP